MDRTRFPRVPRVNAAVAFAAAAFSCSGPDVALRAPVPTRTVVSDPSGKTFLGKTCVPTGIETCYDATDENCNGLVDEGCGLPDGVLQLVAAWQPAEADVELDVIDPRGEQASVGAATTLGLVKDRDCPKEPNECGGQNVEVVSLEADRVPEGRYVVTLRLNHEVPQPASVTVRLGGHIGADAIQGHWTLNGDMPAARLEIERIEPRVDAGNPKL